MTKKSTSSKSKASQTPDVELPSGQGPRPSRRRDDAQARLTHEFICAAAAEMDSSHCTDIIVFDVRDMSDLTDYIIIGTGTSDRQIRSVSRDVADLAKKYNLEKFGSDSDEQANWVVTDFVEVILHMFEPAARAHYDLEMMWGDAPRIDWRKDAPKQKPRG